ncbi:MAG: hypothetical protein IPK04_04765 [Bdellovibrionales bacterium]|nr:hypothetical protein [Bdellovibrionales bacterium]
MRQSVGCETESSDGSFQYFSAFTVQKCWATMDVLRGSGHLPRFFELNRANLHRELNGQGADEEHLGLDQFEHSLWVGMNYRNLIGLDQYRGTFDWIVSNPPYFDPTHGRLPVDKIKARSRFYLDGSFEEFLSAIRWSLAPSGKALILVRDLSDHGIRRQESLQKTFSDQDFQLDWLDPIRGTDLLLVSARSDFSNDR